MEWYDLIDETLKAFLIVPLYSIFNKVYSKKKNDFPKITFLFLIMVFFVYLFFNIGLLFYGHYLIKYMNPNINDISKIKVYLNLETISFMIAIIPTFINVIFVAVGKSKNVYMFLIIQAIRNIISDFVFIPKLGVNGVAISNIVTSSILTVIMCFKT